MSAVGDAQPTWEERLDPRTLGDVVCAPAVRDAVTAFIADSVRGEAAAPPALWLYGTSGVGKSCLLRAAAAAAGVRVEYMDAAAHASVGDMVSTLRARMQARTAVGTAGSQSPVALVIENLEAYIHVQAVRTITDALAQLHELNGAPRDAATRYSVTTATTTTTAPTPNATAAASVAHRKRARMAGGAAAAPAPATRAIAPIPILLTSDTPNDERVLRTALAAAERQGWAARVHMRDASTADVGNYAMRAAAAMRLPPLEPDVQQAIVRAAMGRPRVVVHILETLQRDPAALGAAAAAHTADLFTRAARIMFPGEPPPPLPALPVPPLAAAGAPDAAAAAATAATVAAGILARLEALRVKRAHALATPVPAPAASPPTASPPAATAHTRASAPVPAPAGPSYYAAMKFAPPSAAPPRAPPCGPSYYAMMGRGRAATTPERSAPCTPPTKAAAPMVLAAAPAKAPTPNLVRTPPHARLQRVEAHAGLTATQRHMDGDADLVLQMVQHNMCAWVGRGASPAVLADVAAAFSTADVLAAGLCGGYAAPDDVAALGVWGARVAQGPSAATRRRDGESLALPTRARMLRTAHALEDQLHDVGLEHAVLHAADWTWEGDVQQGEDEDEPLGGVWRRKNTQPPPVPLEKAVAAIPPDVAAFVRSARLLWGHARHVAAAQSRRRRHDGSGDAEDAPAGAASTAVARASLASSVSVALPRGTDLGVVQPSVLKLYERLWLTRAHAAGARAADRPDNPYDAARLLTEVAPPQWYTASARTASTVQLVSRLCTRPLLCTCGAHAHVCDYCAAIAGDPVRAPDGSVLPVY